MHNFWRRTFFWDKNEVLSKKWKVNKLLLCIMGKKFCGGVVCNLRWQHINTNSYDIWYIWYQWRVTGADVCTNCTMKYKMYNAMKYKLYSFCFLWACVHTNEETGACFIYFFDFKGQLVSLLIWTIIKRLKAKNCIL